LLLALVPGVAAAAQPSFQALPSLDLSPKRWTLLKPFTGPQSQPVVQKNTVRVTPEAEARPCAVELRVWRPLRNLFRMPFWRPPEKAHVRELQLPAPPCMAAAADPRK
jgi:hypothetical protein